VITLGIAKLLGSLPNASFLPPTWFLPSGLAYWNFRQSKYPLDDSPLPLSCHRLGFFPQDWHTRTLGGQASHSVIRKVILAITRLAFLHFFFLFSPFLPVSVFALFLNPYT